MKIIQDITEMHSYSTRFRHEGKTIGFVPTMGALHQGHLSLLERAKEESDHVVISIFVNPSQFGPKEEYKQYPRDIKGDTEKVNTAGADTLFMPSVSQIYPEGYSTFVEVEEVSDVMCGKVRPGHFRGVATVVLKLFNIVRPHKAFFGQKDYQQTVIIRKMVNDLNLNAEITVLPIIREADGLAMSSRNQYLNQEERRSATVLCLSLNEARLLFDKGERSADRLKDVIIRIFNSEPSAQLEYVAIVHPETLQEERNVQKGSVIALAARIGKTRVIDNIIL